MGLLRVFLLTVTTGVVGSLVPAGSMRLAGIATAHILPDWLGVQRDVSLRSLCLSAQTAEMRRKGGQRAIAKGHSLQVQISWPTIPNHSDLDLPKQ